MFDWVLNVPETGKYEIYIFIKNKLPVNSKAYLEASRTSAMKLLCENS